jgi:hypothetical protein
MLIEKKIKVLWFRFREGLQQARLVVKTLGSGFHIPAEGVHYLSTVSIL